MHRYQRLIVLALAAGAGPVSAGCSTGAEPSVAEHTDALGTSEANCSNWTLFEQSFTGGGTVISPASYNPSGCAKGYRINLVDYDGVKYNGGALVGYGGTLPTTQADCTTMILRAYVWERGANNVMTFVNNRNKTGSWIVGRDNVGRCLPPVINLEKDIGIVPNGSRDYRVAITARTGADVTVPVVFSTAEKHVMTPADQLSRAQSLSTSLAPRSGSNPDPLLQSLWNIRSTPIAQSYCRTMDFDRGLFAFTRAALIKAGATAATVDARNTELANLRTALCTSGGTLANLHTAVKNYLTNTLSIRTQIRNQLSSLMPGREASTLDMLTANMMTQVMKQGIGALVSKCDLDADPMIRFMTYGQLPAGVTDPTRVVLGSCSNQTPAQAAAGIGFGTTPAGSPNAVSAMASCMAELAETAAETRCSGPRLAGAPDAAQPPTDVCWNGVTYQKCSATLQADKTALDAKVKADAAEQNSVKAKANQDSLPPADAAMENTVNHGEHIANTVSILGFTLTTLVEAKVIAVAALGPVGLGIGLSAGLIANSSAAEWYDWFTGDAPEPAQTVDLRDYCQSDPLGNVWCDHYGGGQNYCPADPVMENYGLPELANLTWYQVGGLNAPRQTTQQDLFTHCLCNMVDADYAAQTRGERPTRAPATSCPQSEDRRKLDCVADPRMRIGDDGRPESRLPQVALSRSRRRCDMAGQGLRIEDLPSQSEAVCHAKR
ncbi:MAG: hypothetical protein QM756_01840 [Polyangiaceae bacterium]